MAPAPACAAGTATAQLEKNDFPSLPNFKVLKLLGKGAYGRVYKVQRESDERTYALKETDLTSLTQMERMDAVNEIRLLVSINHPSVIRYYEAFLHGSKLCVVMEYAPYGDLRYYINKGRRLESPFPEEAIWRIFLQMCRGLQALHANNIIHRDFKPANMFLCQNDVLKIGDLGVAKALTGLEMTRTQIGTPVYMAPEVWAGKPYSYSSDLWSLGCALYEMIMFKVPIEGRNIHELKLKVATGHFTSIQPGTYSAELINICHSLLTVDPQKRPTPQSILTSPAASKWLYVLPAITPNVRWSDSGAPKQRGNLMNTIVVPKDLRQLVLPPPAYDPLPGERSSDSVGKSKESSRLPSPKLAASQALSVPPKEPKREGGGAPVSRVFRGSSGPQPRMSYGGGPVYTGYGAAAPAAVMAPQLKAVPVPPVKKASDMLPALKPVPRRISCS